MIAISYRRADTKPVASRLCDKLQTEFDRENVFMDLDSIPYGIDFRERLKKTFTRVDVVIAVIGPNWLGQKDDGNRRIDDPTDLVRWEIAYTLERGIPLIPVLVDGASMPSRKILPSDIEGIASRNALTLDSGLDFHHHADRLISSIYDIRNAASRTIVRSNTPAGPVRDARNASGAAGKPPRPSRPGRKTLVIVAMIILAAVCAIIGRYSARLGRGTRIDALTPPITPIPERIMDQTIVETLVTPVATIAVAESTPVTMMTSVIATPPQIRTATPVDADIDEIRQFVRDYYADFERRDADAVAARFNNTADYQGEGIHDRNYIRADAARYFTQWQRLQYDLSPILVSATNNDEFTVSFGLTYTVENRSTRLAGRTTNVWIVRKVDGNPRITFQTETAVKRNSR